MKKVYLKPAMEVEELEMQKSILSGSQIESGGDKSTGEGQAKERGIWGDLWYENQ